MVPHNHEDAPLATGRLSFEIGLSLLHPTRVKACYGVLSSPGGPQAVAPVQEPPRLMLPLVSVAELETLPHFLPNGDLPLTVTVQDLMGSRDKPPARPGKVKPIPHRPTSIQQWQYEAEAPPLAHWAAQQGGGS